MTVLACSGLSVGFGSSPVLADVNLSVEAGDVVAIMGASGSGKSSLLLTLAGLLPPLAGRVLLGGTDLGRVTGRRASDLRLRQIGFVFQFADLVPELTTLENVELPLRLAGRPRTEARLEAGEIMDLLGVSPLADRRTYEVSGGELQRVAVCRALVHRPRVVFADEPTGALDETNGDAVLELFLRAARERSGAVVMVTHDPAVARRADRVLLARLGDLVATDLTAVEPLA